MSNSRKQRRNAHKSIVKKMDNEGKPVEKREEFSYRQMTVSSPLPPPEWLERYNQTIPNGAERILIMVEKQSEHRQKLENKAIASQITQNYISQIIGFTIAICGIGASVYMAINDATAASVALSSGTLGSLVAVFFKGRDSQKKELAEKNNN